MADDRPLLETLPDRSEGESQESMGSVRKRITPEERAIVNRCLDAVEARGQQLQKKGLTKINFIGGVANSLFVAWSFGAIPEHFWIVYMCEVVWLFPLRWNNQIRARPLKEHFFWCDFCWVANFALFLSMVALVVHSLLASPIVPKPVLVDIRRLIFAAAWGLGCGPLLLATGLLGNALLFHDADNVASVLIHLFPSLVLYVLGWQNERVHEAWPRVFLLHYFQGLRAWDIFFSAASVYTLWALFYTIWLLVHGRRLPKSGFDTIYHYNMRAGFGKLIAKVLRTPQDDYKRMRSTNEFPISYLLLYMFGHVLLVYVGISFSLLCFMSKYFHCGACGVMTLATIYNGASRYTFYIIKNYGIVLRNELGIPLNRKASAMEYSFE